MDRLWAPWRAQYIKESVRPGPSEADDGCFLCRGLANRKSMPIATISWPGAVPTRPSSSTSILIITATFLVAPLVHRGQLGELEGADLTEPLETVRRAVGVLDRIFRPQGYNVGLNLGKAAGAGLPGHLHWHIVPRWDGDTNFMPVLGQTKVIVESLAEFYDRLVVEMGRPRLTPTKLRPKPPPNP